MARYSLALLLLIPSLAGANQLKTDGLFQTQGLLKIGSTTGLAPVTGTEFACTALGTHCDCSEPMQSNQTINDSNVNFSDSPSLTDCDPSFFGMGGDGSMTMISVAGQPGWGNALWAVNHGWANSSDRNMNISFKSNIPNITNFTSANRSWGVRYYRQFDTAYDRAGGSGPGDTTCPPFGTWRNKTFQTSHSNTGLHDLGASGSTTVVAEMQVQEDPSPAHCSSGAPSNVWQIGGHLSGGGDINNVSLSPSLTAQDCDSKPCRFEMMVDTASTGAFTSGGTFTWRTRVCSQETGTCSTQTVTGPDGQFDNFYFWWGADINHSGTSSGGSREAYFVSGIWNDVDSTRWIGPACEIENC